jgi:inhibitor of KinA sporulation pathway (predicted exonuclease)
VCDVEATCDRTTKFADYSHEIIEFPVVVVDLHAGGGVVDEFHSYVRPTQNTTLSDFCTELTGITQATVDAAPTLPEVLEAFEAWRLERGYRHDDEAKDFAFGADGPWDLRYFLHGECTRKGVPKRAYFDKWVNIKQLFADHYRVRTMKIHKMLQLQGMAFEGRLHSGIDDTRNIARIALKMRDDGCVVYLNEALPPRQRSGALAELTSLSVF